MYSRKCLRSFGYDSFGALASQTAMQGTTNLLQMTYVGGAAPARQHGPHQDQGRNLARCNESHVQLHLRPLGRLTQVTDTQGATTTTTESYTYDNDEIDSPRSNTPRPSRPLRRPRPPQTHSGPAMATPGHSPTPTMAPYRRAWTTLQDSASS